MDHKKASDIDRSIQLPFRECSAQQSEHHCIWLPHTVQLGQNWLFTFPRVLPCSTTRAFRLQPDPVQVQVSLKSSGKTFPALTTRRKLQVPSAGFLSMPGTMAAMRPFMSSEEGDNAATVCSYACLP